MTLGHGASVMRDGLVLHLDAANAKSYPGKTGPELVTNEVITQEDGNTFNVFRDANTNTILPLCSVVSGKYYIVKYVISSYTGGVGATFRINGGGANLTPIIGISSAGTFTKTFQANVSGSLSINGDNTGTDFEVDFVSVKEMISNTGTTWKDLSGNGNNGTLTNGPVYSSTNSGYITFDAVDDYIDMGASSAIDNLNEFTISAWIKTGTGTTERGIVAKGPTNEFTGVTNDGWSLRIRQGVPGFSLRKADNSGYVDIFNGTNVENDTWCMITGTFDTTTVKRYLNGSLEQQTGTGQSYLKNTHSLKIGILGSKSLNGELSSVLLYNRVLSQVEITQNFEALRGRYGI